MASRKPIDSPGVAIPPLRPEAPKATVSRSKTATVAPLRARCRAADRPVSPAPTTATSTLPPTSVLDRSGPSGAVSSQYGLNFIGDLSPVGRGRGWTHGSCGCCGSETEQGRQARQVLDLVVAVVQGARLVAAVDVDLVADA